MKYPYLFGSILAITECLSGCGGSADALFEQTTDPNADAQTDNEQPDSQVAADSGKDSGTAGSSGAEGGVDGQVEKDSALPDTALDSSSDTGGEKDSSIDTSVDAKPDSPLDSGIKDSSADTNTDAQDSGKDSGKDTGQESGVDAGQDTATGQDSSVDVGQDTGDGASDSSAPDTAADSGIPECYNGQGRCLGNTAQLCKGQKWTDLEACGGKICLALQDFGSCIDQPLANSPRPPFQYGPETVTNYRWNGTSLQAESKSATVYDAKKRFDTVTDSNFVGGVWTQSKKTTYSYDAISGKPTQELFEILNTVWEPAEQWAWSYDSQGKPSRHERRTYVKGVLQPANYAVIYEYQADGKLWKERVSTLQQNGTWKSQFVDIYAYDSKGYLVRDAFTNYSKDRDTLFGWDAKDRLVLKYFQFSYDYVQNGYMTLAYTPSGYVDLVKQFRISSGVTSKESYAYTSGRLSSRSSDSYDAIGQTWTSSAKVVILHTDTGSSANFEFNPNPERDWLMNYYGVSP